MEVANSTYSSALAGLPGSLQTSTIVTYLLHVEGPLVKYLGSDATGASHYLQVRILAQLQPSQCHPRIIISDALCMWQDIMSRLTTAITSAALP